jgi:hypothetical protein
MTASCKHTSLPRYGLNYGRKKSLSVGPLQDNLVKREEIMFVLVS